MREPNSTKLEESEFSSISLLLERRRREEGRVEVETFDGGGEDGKSGGEGEFGVLRSLDEEVADWDRNASSSEC